MAHLEVPMRAIGTFTLGLVLLATIPVLSQEQSATPAKNVPMSPDGRVVRHVKDGWILSVWIDGNVTENGSDAAKALQKRLLTWASQKAIEVDIPIDAYDINDTNRYGHPVSPKEAFDNFPGRDLWTSRLKEGDVVITRERMKDSKVASRSFPMCLGGPVDAPLALDGLLQPVKTPQVVRPGDILVLWHTGDKKQAALDCEAAVKSAQLKFEEYDVTTPEGKTKFERRMAKFSPATRLKLMQEVKTAYLQRGWAMDNDTIQFGEPQELSTLVPVADTATLFVSKTTDPANGRKAPAQ